MSTAETPRVVAATVVFLGALLPAAWFLNDAHSRQRVTAASRELAPAPVWLGDDPPPATGAALGVDPTLVLDGVSSFKTHRPASRLGSLDRTRTSPCIRVLRRTRQHLVVEVAGGWGDRCVGPMNSVRVEFWAAPAQVSSWWILESCLGPLEYDGMTQATPSEGLHSLGGDVTVSELDGGLPKPGAIVRFWLTSNPGAALGGPQGYEANFVIP